MKILRSLLLVSLAVFLLTACSKESVFENKNILLFESTEQSNRSKLILPNELSRPIRGSYIVVFKEDSKNFDGEIENLKKNLGFKVNFVYRNAFHGFAAELNDNSLNALLNNPNIDYIEQDQVFNAIGTQSSPPSWGLDRIDQREGGLNNSYTTTKTGKGVEAYIFDTGINYTHTDFQGRVLTSTFFDAFSGGDGKDQNGHGTHCAGTVGGSSYGVAKEVTLISVRVLSASGSGSTSGVAAGLDWAVNNHQANVLAVGNMSLGGGASTTIDNAVRRAIADGIVMCVAAGNSYRDAKNFSPARVSEAITVGATSKSSIMPYDRFASYSNFGSIVDILAPGSSITSTWHTDNSATAVLSGTSMATPHVAGVAALYLSANPTIGSGTTSAVSSALRAIATPNAVSNVPRSTVNLLLFTNY